MLAKTLYISPMKKPLLAILLTITTLALQAQDTTKNITDTTATKKWELLNKKRTLDIGGGIQYSDIMRMSNFYMGPSISCKVNSKYGRIAGLFNLSYQFGRKYYVFNDAVYYSGYKNTYPPTAFYSDAQYNFAKVSAAMMVPFFNRTNKKGFAISGIFGLSYYNGLGSGKYVSFLDKPNPPVINPNDMGYIYSSTKFSFGNYNLSLISVDIMLSANYTFKRYQLFADGGLIAVAHLQKTKRTDSESMAAFFGGMGRKDSPSYNINIGLRYCLYQPWQTKPPKRRAPKLINQKQ